MRQDGEDTEGAGDPAGDEGDPAVHDELDRFERLDRLVRVLVGRFEALTREHREALVQLAKRDEQIRELNQRRQDAAKRLDEVLGCLDRLDADLERRAELPPEKG